jgi:extracellular factor (EF) 3-hydroxypalmitic acid methyl ester biosynthesis protein
MNQNFVEIKANLVEGKTTIPIDVKYTSKYSFLIRFLNSNSFKNEAEFSKLIIQMNGRSFELGRCQFLSEPNIDGYAGRLIFINDIYDIESLMFDNKIVRLQNACLNLPLILNLKHNIAESFHKYTANLTYDLSVYKNLFDNLDAEYSKEPEHIRNSLQQTVINTVGREFMGFLDDKLLELEQIIRNFSKDQHKDHGFYFRKQLWNTIICAPFMTRTNLKPRGYAGDSDMMSMIYANDYRGNSTYSKLMHKHPLEQPAAQAVRNRRKIIAKMIRNLNKDSNRGNNKKLKILSVACGPACEIQDVLISTKDCEKFHFVLLDQDRTALYDAARLIDQTEKKLDNKIAVDYLNESVRTMLAAPLLKNKVGQFNFIYSMGLFDYLLPPVASAVIGKLYQLLKPGGQMLIGNFHVSNSSKYYMEYWLDWAIYYRTEEDFKSLLMDAPSADVDMFFEDAGIQMFLHVKKKSKPDFDSKNIQ